MVNSVRELYARGGVSRAAEAVVLMPARDSMCSEQRLDHLAAAANVGQNRDVWLLHDQNVPTAPPRASSMPSNVHVASKPALPPTPAWRSLATDSHGDAAHFVAFLATSRYYHAWFVRNDISLHEGDWGSLFSFAGVTDIVARTTANNFTAGCTLKKSRCASTFAPVQLDWSMVRLSRRVALIIMDRLSDATYSVSGPAAEIVPALCIMCQARCRIAKLDGSLGRPLVTPADSDTARGAGDASAIQAACKAVRMRVEYGACDVDPFRLMRWDRFDIYVKMAYADVFIEQQLEPMPAFVSSVYTEHLRIWNGFVEANCAYFSNFHANCTNKRTADAFVSSFDTVIRSMRSQGFSTTPGAAVPVAQNGFPINGAHRIAAAAAAKVRVKVYAIPDEASTLYRLSKTGKPIGPSGHAQLYDSRYFVDKGLPRKYSDWVAHRAIRANAALHVVHLWPRAVAKGVTLKREVERIVASQCAIDGGILYQKEVNLTSKGLNIYLKHAYGDVAWLQPERYWGDGAPLAVYVVRSDRARMGACRESVRKLYALPRQLYKASVHVTDYQTEAIMASQMLLNDNSVAYMNHPLVDWTTCNGVASAHAASLRATGAAPQAVLSTHNRQQSRPIYLLPESAAVDTGTAMAILGLRPFTDVDLVWSSPLELGNRLVSTCKHRRGSRCNHTYGTHNPPTVWWTYHNLSAPAELIHNPELHGFCSGLKFVAPAQLLRYKRLRFKRRGQAKDRIDTELLEHKFFGSGN